MIAAYGREFAKTNLLLPDHHRSLRDGFETRQIGDYSFEASVSEDKAQQVLEGAKAFLIAAKKYLASQNTSL